MENIEPSIDNKFIIMICILIFVSLMIAKFIKDHINAENKTKATYKNPKILSADYAGIPLNVCSIENDKILLQIGSLDSDWPVANKQWFFIENISNEFKNIGSWFCLKTLPDGTSHYEKVLMYQGESRIPINP